MAGDDKEREHCLAVALAHTRICGYAGEGLPLDGSGEKATLAEAFARERAAAAAETRDADLLAIEAACGHDPGPCRLCAPYLYAIRALRGGGR